MGTDPAVTGYKVYYLDVVLTNLTAVDAGNTNTLEIAGLSAGRTYSFYATAYNAAGVESGPSAAVVFTLPLPPLSQTAATDAQGRPTLQIHADGLPGLTVLLQTSTNLAIWATLATGQAGQPVDIVVGDLLSEPRRFYRSVVSP
jgi:hypothetical protein